MQTLIVKNIISEGPGTIGDYLYEQGIPYMTVELWAGEPPPSLEGYDFLVILGGPMGAYEMNEYPHLAVASRLIRNAIDRGMGVLGICLGAQLMAHCLGADVYKCPQKEIGWLDIELTSEGLKDAFMKKLAIHPAVGDFWKRFKVFQWHGDTFNIPEGAIRLAGSELIPNQAFKYGNRAYAFQFHIEVTKQMLAEWFGGFTEKDEILEMTDKLYSEYHGRAKAFYKAFFKEV